MLYLMKFWPRYLRLKTIDIFQKIISFHLFYCLEFKDQGQICNLLIMRIPKLTLIIEIDEELTEIFGNEKDENEINF